MSRVEQIVLGWFAAIVIWLIYAVNTPFWEAYFYWTWQTAFALLILELRPKINFYFMLSAQVFNAEFLVYNILIAYKKAPHPEVFVKYFLISIFILLLTTFIYNIWHSRR